MSGLFNTTLQIGGALGVAVFGTVYLGLTASGSTPQMAFAVTIGAMAGLSLGAAMLFRQAHHAGTPSV